MAKKKPVKPLKPKPTNPVPQDSGNGPTPPGQ